MNENKSKWDQLTDKVYAYLNTIDISKLSMNDIKDFLEVVQKGQFLESYGTVSPYSWGFGAPVSPCGNPSSCGASESEKVE